MRRLLLPAAALFLWGCSDSTAPRVATSVTIAPGSVSFDALGATQVVRATVNDQNGKPMDPGALSWTSSAAGVTVVGAGGDSAVVRSVANGSATITAKSGEATGTAQAQVQQVAVTLEKGSPDFGTAPAGGVLAPQVRVVVRDRLGMPVVGQTITFTIITGGGSVSSATVVTGADGSANTTWTLGATAGANTLSASAPGSPAASVIFTATGTSAASATISIFNGGFQAAMEGDTLPQRPAVVVRDGAGAPISGVVVNFTVTSGGGSITVATATTDASGVATTRWRLGSPANLNTLAASAAGTSGGPVVFRGAGCSGGGAGFEITVCIASTMTSSQRQVFQTSAARWSSIIKGDLPDVGGAVPADACGPSPSANQVYDDLLIFAAIVDIDGPGQVLGQASPCFVRSTGKLPVIGMMRFDAADMAALETNGQFGNVILHEMGHVLGVGTLWELLGLLQNKSTTTAPVDTYFSGAGAIAAFDAVGGTAYTGGQKVPVENTGGAGTMNGHWRESVMRNELMTGYLNAGSNPLSVVTVRALGDMGYTVDPAAADPYFLATALREGAEAPTLRMHDDIYRIPLYTITPQGARTRIR